MWQVETVEVTGDEPVTLIEAKAHLVVEHDDHDDLIERLVSVAREVAEARTGLLLREQSLTITYDGFSTPLELPRAPITEISAIAYSDAAATMATIDEGDYLYRREFGVPVLRPSLTASSWPSFYVGGSVVVSAAGGHTPATCPQAVKQAILLMVGDLYKNRETGVAGTISQPIATSLSVDVLLGTARLHWI